ncbi:PIN domain-containing protein [Candidatus Pacearchaeota archaeon]|nr:PIN domain-containing protein [Candidatus Pacearchaeota archaeon]
MKNDEKAISKLNEIIKKGETQLITALTIFELFSGISRSNQPEKEKNKVIKILKGQLILHLDNDSAEKAGEIDGNLIKRGEDIGPIDCMISGIALVKKEKVLTRNIEDFKKIKGLEIETY